MFYGTHGNNTDNVPNAPRVFTQVPFCAFFVCVSAIPPINSWRKVWQLPTLNL